MRLVLQGAQQPEPRFINMRNTRNELNAFFSPPPPRVSLSVFCCFPLKAALLVRSAHTGPRFATSKLSVCLASLESVSVAVPTCGALLCNMKKGKEPK